MNRRLLHHLKSFFLLVALCMGTSSGMAQTTVQVGTGTGTTTNFPIYSCYGYNYSQQIYLGSEITAGGASGASYISKIRFYYSSTSYNYDFSTWNQWTIYMGNTGQSSFANIASWIPSSALTQVYSGTIGTTMPTGNTWVEITLTTPFYWDGTSNLVVAIDENAASYDCTANWGSYTATAASGTRGLLFYDDATNPNPTAPPAANYSGNDLARVQFVVAPAPACTAPPTAGTASVSNATPCLNSDLQLAVSGSSIGAGITYQWESAPTAAGPWTPIGTPSGSPFLITQASASLFYQAVVSCGASTATTNVVSTTVPVLFPGGTYTIDNTIPASATNFTSFASAASAINCGITSPIVFNVTAATYANDRFLLDNLNATSGHSITVNGNGATMTFVSTNAAERAGIRLDGTDYVTINNLNIVATGTTTSQYGYGIHMFNGADFNTISNCTITVDTVSTSTNYTPIVVSGNPYSPTSAGSNSDNNTFTGNTLNGGYYSIVLYGNAAAPLISNNTISNNVIKNFYNYGIYVYGSNATIIEGNDISRPTRTNSTTFAGIIFSGPTTSNVFNRNRIHNVFDAFPTSTSTAYGIFSSAADGTTGNENVVSNNLIYNINHNGTIYGIYNSGSDNYRYYHNTISLDNTSSTTTSATRGVYQTTSAIGLQFVNNIISITRGGTGINHGIYMNTATTTWTANNNDYFIMGAGPNNIGYASSTSHTTLGSWQAATSQDMNSTIEPPLFANPAAGDFTPGNSLIDNTGALVGVTTDIVNAPRSASTPDIGAYEFTIPPCSGMPTAGSATANGAISAQVCMGGSIFFQAQGFSTGAGIVYQWESSPVGQNNWTAVLGAASSIYQSTFAAPFDYRLAVTCLGNTVYTNTVTVTQNPFYFCYCSPLNGTTLHGTTTNYTTDVAIASTPLNSPSSAVGAGGYTFKDPSVPANTATLAKGTAYTLTLTQSSTSTSIKSQFWIDWDHSGTFDASEYYTTTRSGTISTATITPPAGAMIGMTGMRIRTLFSSTATAAYGSTGACTNLSTGRETEDYVIHIDHPLDIKISKISAENFGSKNRVDWTTLSEGKGDVFNVERSVDGSSFSYLRTVNGNGEASTYSFWDESPVSGTNYYRLKLVDASGSFTYSTVVSANVKGSPVAIEVYPNPVLDVVTVRVNRKASLNATVTLTDVAGKVVSSTALSNTEVKIDMSGLASGIYLIKYTDSDYSETFKVNKK